MRLTRSLAGTRRPHLSGQALAAGSLAALLHVSPRTMSTRVDHARRVVCALPQVQALAWSGDLEPYRVDAVVAESLAAPDRYGCTSSRPASWKVTSPSLP